MDYINIVVQFVSNVGNSAAPGLEVVLHQIEAERLVDDIHIYEPDFSIAPVRNELNKRNIGLQLAKNAGVSHFLTMDCDEYYPSDEFAAAKNFIEANNIISTAVRTYLHIKRPIWRSEMPDNTCCAFLTKIEEADELVLDAPYPAAFVDPTRRLNGSNQTLLLPLELISMRHMNLVRIDLNNKLNNSSNAAATEFMSKVKAAYGEWEFGQDLNFPGKPPMKIIEVKDIFGIDDQFDRYS
ncbi:hypothetical protein [Ensifer sp. ENS03]|uniref:hypothetical protein n=1 Tax=Ensifer sp. ENS03 TaxID=2769283 RepID=UPI001AEED7D5|nr:hypothetical protein [Ensifer sp. ENS03]